MEKDKFQRFAHLGFDDFKKLAQDDQLSPYEKIGFPNEYRAGKEEFIFQDITQKLPRLGSTNQVVLDIGPGCSGLAFMVIDLCRRQGHRLILVDSQEMLSQLPDEPFIEKIPAYYPDECPQLFEQASRQVNVALTYSVLHYVFAEGNLFGFIDRTLSLLADGGEFLIGDIPNISKRKRFFAAPAGIRFHQEFMQTDEVPQVEFNKLEAGQIDDAVIFSILMRCRQAGCDAYCLPQPENLPMSNRREDILIRKP